MLSELRKPPVSKNSIRPLLSFFASASPGASPKPECKPSPIKVEAQSQLEVKSEGDSDEQETQETQECLSEPEEEVPTPKKEKKDYFDDFDVDDVDMLFISQQKWIERTLEAERKKQDSSPALNRCPTMPTPEPPEIPQVARSYSETIPMAGRKRFRSTDQSTPPPKKATTPSRTPQKTLFSFFKFNVN